jgi:hypothetical protein
VSSDDIDPSEFEPDSEDAGLPLTAADLPTVRAELTEWMDAREFQRRVHGFDTDRKFNDNKYKFLREAWVLAELSKHKPFVRIRLGEDPPDGYAQTENGDVLEIEITSAQTPGRALGAQNTMIKKSRRNTIKSMKPRFLPRRWRMPSRRR